MTETSHPYTPIFIDDQQSFSKDLLLASAKPNPSLAGIGRGTPIIPKDEDRQEQDTPLLRAESGKSLICRDTISKDADVSLPVGDQDLQSQNEPRTMNFDVFAKLKSCPYAIYKYWMIINVIWTSITIVSSLVVIKQVFHEMVYIRTSGYGAKGIYRLIIVFCFDLIFLLLRVLHIVFTWQAVQAIRRRNPSKINSAINLMKKYIITSTILECVFECLVMNTKWYDLLKIMDVRLPHHIAFLFAYYIIRFAFFYLFYMFGALKVKKLL